MTLGTTISTSSFSTLSSEQETPIVKVVVKITTAPMMNLTKNRILVVRVKEANPLLRFPCSALKRLIIINISSSSRCELNARRRIKSAQKQTERRRKRVVVFKPTSLSFALYSRFNHSLFVRTTVRVRETKTTENNSSF
jgi:hypothetical protein